MHTRIAVWINLVAAMAAAATVVVAGDMPGFGDIYQTGGDGYQAGTVLDQHQSLTSVVDVAQLAQNYGWTNQGAWQGAPVQPFGQSDGYGQTSPYGISQSSASGSPLAQTASQDFYGDENRTWLPTFEEFWRLTPEQQAQYRKQIDDYRRQLADDLKRRSNSELENLKAYRQRLADQRRDEDRTVDEVRRQLADEVNRQQQRMSDDVRQQKEQLNAQQRQIETYYKDSPLQRVQALEQLRLQGIQLDMQAQMARDQLADQRAQKESELNQRRAALAAQRAEQDGQLKIRQIEFEARIRLAMLSLQGPIFRDQVTAPTFDTGGRLVSEKYREFYRARMAAWIDQRKYEEQRILELQKAREAVAAVQAQVYKTKRQASFDAEALSAKERMKMATLQAAREAKQRSYEARLQKEQTVAQRRVQDAQLDLYLRQQQAAGARVDSQALQNYRNQLAAQRRQQDDQFRLAEQAQANQVKQDADQRRAADEQLNRSIADGRERLGREFRDYDQAYQRQVRDIQDQLKRWSDERRRQETEAKQAYDRWLADQNKAYQDWQRALANPAGTTR